MIVRITKTSYDYLDNQDEGRLPLFKPRTDDEDMSMQEDKGEEEEKSEEANTNITLEDTEQLLKQVGTQYAEDNAQKNPIKKG